MSSDVARTLAICITRVNCAFFASSEQEKEEKLLTTAAVRTFNVTIRETIVCFDQSKMNQSSSILV
jgi:hypothetical protein